MGDLIGKFSTYHLFNYLLSGCLFVAILNNISSISLIQTNTFLAPFLYYFIGLIFSRSGSSILRMLTKKLKIVCFQKYEDFIAATKKDSQIDLLCETSNLYETLLSTFLTLLMVYICINWWFFITLKGVLLFTAVIILMISYHDHNDYINKRIKFALSSNTAA